MDQPAPSAQDEYLERLAAYLPPQRIEHSLNVAKSAQQLAQLHCPELASKAWIAGVVHDNAKHIPADELLAHARNLGIVVSPEEQSSPGLLHGKVGAALLPERFGVRDAEIGMAVADHVTGRPGMGGLSLVLYVADQAAADRTFEGVEQLRKLAQADLFKAAALVCRYKLMYILESGKPIIMDTVALYNELQSTLRNADA